MKEKNTERQELKANILFSGIGSQEIGIKEAGLPRLKVMSTSEIDSSAVLTNAIIHYGLTQKMVEDFRDYPDTDIMVRELTEKNIGFNPKTGKAYDWARHKRRGILHIRRVWLAVHLTRNLGDISRIEKLPCADLWTVSFPCQDISNAGKRGGFEKDSGTKSSLVWEQIRLLKKAVSDGEAPVVLMFENVKGLVQKNFIKDFQMLCGRLSELGYNTYYKVLNAKDFGVPQNRERVFAYCIRKDADNGTYTFPEPTGIRTSLDDILDPKHASKTRTYSKGAAKAASTGVQGHGR